ncbi:MAG: hypothetical protein FWG73_02380 [Planctomycetaceae bacterium]|nr:hypothetical protein [Planctomycetaceae bacterium]
MDRYPAFIRCFVILLAALYALADGHLLCAPCLANDDTHHVGHDCEHSTLPPMPTVHAATCCLGDFDGGRLLCNGNDLPAITVQCISNEFVKSLEFSLADCGFTVPGEIPVQSNADFCDDSAFLASAHSVRLHLLYGVLLN